MHAPLKLVKTRPTGNGRARGLVSNRASGERVEARTYAPPEHQRDVVAAYWVARWDLRDDVPHVTELLGDPCIHFVFEEGGEHAGNRLVGVWTGLWRRTLAGKGLIRGVKLRAGAARAFLTLPAQHFTNRVVPLTSVFGSDLKRLERAVLEPRDDGEAFAVFDTWLAAARLASDPAEVRRAVALAERIANDLDITSVRRLASVSGLTLRALQRLFREHVGGSPKWVILRNRLQEAALRIERGEGPTLAALAANLGYTDQAHLTRDFKRVVGKTPSEFAVTTRPGARSG